MRQVKNHLCLDYDSGGKREVKIESVEPTTGAPERDAAKTIEPTECMESLPAKPIESKGPIENIDPTQDIGPTEDIKPADIEEPVITIEEPVIRNE